MDELTDDALTQDFRVYQRARGHRFSFDDVITAWTAARARPGALRIVDLGTGIGSVLIMLAWRFREARLVGIEAQQESFALLEKNLERNDLGGRVHAIQGDIRDRTTLERARAAFDGGAPGPELVTGTPPYMPAGNGPISPDPQRAHARVELRGGVEEYVAAAARLAGPETAVVLCSGAQRPERVERAAESCELAIAGRRDVIAREGSKGPLFTVWTLRRTATFVPEPPLVLRDRAGARTRDAIELRESFGLAPNPDEAPCP